MVKQVISESPEKPNRVMIEAGFADSASVQVESVREVPLSFVQADICREDLLVEIEAEKIGYN